MKKYNLLAAVATLMHIVGCNSSKKEDLGKIEKPNIVFILADDQCYNTINKLGNNEVITPNLDRMVENGVTFTHAYNMGSWSGAVSVASRTMLTSGKSVWDASEYDRTNFHQGNANDSTWSRLMAQQGYETYFTGKWHVKTPVRNVFNNVVHVRGGMPKDHWDHATMVQNFKHLDEGKKWKSYLEFMPLGYNRPLSEDDRSWSPTDTTQGGYWEGGQHWSEVLRDDAINFIDSASQKDEPFFMYLAFNAPHDPRQAPQEYLDMYDAEKLSLPDNFAPLYPEMVAIGNGPSLRDAALAPFPRTEYATRVHLREYYALITHLDEQVGQIMDALEKSGKADNTYIIYTADHGLAVGDHGLFGKQNMYDHSLRVPFIIIGPNLEKNKRVDADIYLQDAMATALDLAGFEKGESIFYNSVMPLALGKSEKSAYQSIYGAYLNLQRMIRKDGYKLILYPEAHKVKLFNLNEDPKEMNNLADNPAYKQKVKEMFNELLDLQENMHDKLDLNEYFSNLQ